MAKYGKRKNTEKENQSGILLKNNKSEHASNLELNIR